MEIHEILDQPAHERPVLDLYNANLITSEARDRALAKIRPAQHWWRWANRSLLFVGSALLLAGIVFFFAYNWSRMDAVPKFCVIEMGLWICAIAGLKVGLDKLTGKVLLLAASVFVGVLLAVFGQAYQTGADAYQNYLLWAVLIFPWVIIGRFAALWILWLVVTNVAMSLCWVQVHVPENFGFELGIFLILGIWNSVALIGREQLASHGLDWLKEIWTRHLIWFSVLAYFTIPTMVAIFEPEFGNGSWAGAIAWVATIVAGQVYFRRVKPDLMAIGLNVFSCCIVLLTLIGKLVFEISDGAISFLVFGLIVLGVSSAAAFYMRNLALRGGVTNEASHK